MRVSLLVYGALYVVIEVVGHQLRQVGWARISPLDVATAVTDAFLTVAVCAALLLALDLGARRWRRSTAAWRLAQDGLTAYEWDDAPIGVSSWRPAPPALSAPATRSTYGGNPYSFAGHRYPKDPGTLL